MPVGDGDADAMGRNDRGGGAHDGAILDMSPDFEWLLFALFFLAADVGDDIVHHFGPALKGFPGAGNGLIGGNDNFLGFQIHERRQGRDIGLDGTVGLYGDKAGSGAQTLALQGDDARVLRIDFRDDHGDIRHHAVG